MQLIFTFAFGVGRAHSAPPSQFSVVHYECQCYPSLNWQMNVETMGKPTANNDKGRGQYGINLIMRPAKVCFLDIRSAMLCQNAKERTEFQPPLFEGQTMLKIGLSGELFQRREDDFTTDQTENVEKKAHNQLTD
ncbi:hypothetical protein niasHT_011026 [Heterodera trifolii]|uniref:Secreted protein n=1 Tax=Heterodera trifolii TaxID=157864 RepID=A0ABD2L9D7_9BILA